MPFPNNVMSKAPLHLVLRLSSSSSITITSGYNSFENLTIDWSFSCKLRSSRNWLLGLWLIGNHLILRHCLRWQVLSFFLTIQPETMIHYWRSYYHRPPYSFYCGPWLSWPVLTHWSIWLVSSGNSSSCALNVLSTLSLSLCQYFIF